MSNHSNLSALIESALIAALAMALSYIPDFASWFSPSFGAIPLILFSLRRGAKYGLLAGLIWGLLHFVLGKVYYLSISQVLIEYILAFISMGLAGFFAKPFQDSIIKNEKSKTFTYTILAAFVAVGSRYFWHFIAGIIFWGSYAPKSMSPLLYSLWVNGTAGGLTFGFVVITLIIILPMHSYLLKPRN